jgi:hypothetical protein
MMSLRSALALSATLSLPFLAPAQLLFNAVNAPVNLDFTTTLMGVSNGLFDAQTVAGASMPGPGQLDTDAWNYLVDGSFTNAAQHATNYPGSLSQGNGVNVGGSLVGGLNATDINGQRCLSVQPTGTHWTSGSIDLRAFNVSGSPVDQMAVSFDVYWFNDQPRSSALRFLYSNTALENSFTEVAAARTASAEVGDPSPEWLLTQVSFTIGGFTMNDGDAIYFRWVGDDVGGSGNRDELAIGNITITPQVSSGPTLFADPDALAPFTQFVNTPSVEQTVTVSANQLTADMSISTTAPFEVSLTSGSGFGQSLTITPANGTVAATTIFTRLNSTIVGPFTGTINVASAAAAPQVVQVSGEATPNIGINELAAAPPLNAWPIPATGDVLHLDRVVSGVVIGLDGQVVMQVRRTAQLNVAALAAGAYTLRCTDGARLRFVRAN